MIVNPTDSYYAYYHPCNRARHYVYPAQPSPSSRVTEAVESLSLTQSDSLQTAEVTPHLACTSILYGSL